MKKLSKRIMSVAAALALVVVLGVCLTACGNGEASFETYRSRLEDAGYTVITAKGEALQEYKEMIEGSGSEISIDDVDWYIMGTKGTGEDAQFVSLMRFKDGSKAKEMMDEAAAEEEDMPEGWAYDRQGNVIVVGSEAGVNLALGK